MHFVISEGKLLNEPRKTSAVRANRSLLISAQFIPCQCVLSTKPGRSHPATARTPTALLMLSLGYSVITAQLPNSLSIYF